jgi:hypothetical protein
MDPNQNMQGQKCPCPHHKMVPIFLILIGLTFLLNTFMVIDSHVTAIIWPILVIAIGLQKIFETRCSCCSRM